MNWKQKIEAQIARARLVLTDSPQKNRALTEALDSAEALLDVAVAADVVMHNYDDQTTSVIAWDALSSALDKLREVGDGV